MFLSDGCITVSLWHDWQPGSHPYHDIRLGFASKDSTPLPGAGSGQAGALYRPAGGASHLSCTRLPTSHLPAGAPPPVFAPSFVRGMTHARSSQIFRMHSGRLVKPSV